MRELPFRPIALTVALVFTLGVGHALLQRRQVRAQQAAILVQRDALTAEVQAPLSNLSTRVERWAVELATQPFGEAKAGTLPRDTSAIYLRIGAAEATSATSVHTRAQLGVVDGLAACLVQPKAGAIWSYGDLVATSELVGPTFEASVRASWDRLSLDGHERTLTHHREGHHAVLKEALARSTHAIVAVDEGSGGFVRVSVRRLSDGVEVLRARRAPSYTLVTVAGIPTELGKQQAAGCSVATDLFASR